MGARQCVSSGLYYFTFDSVWNDRYVNTLAQIESGLRTDSSIRLQQLVQWITALSRGALGMCPVLHNPINQTVPHAPRGLALSVHSTLDVSSPQTRPPIHHTSNTRHLQNLSTIEMVAISHVFRRLTLIHAWKHRLYLSKRVIMTIYTYRFYLCFLIFYFRNIQVNIIFHIYPVYSAKPSLYSRYNHNR